MRAIFLDRDGVINRKAQAPDRYIQSVSQLELLPGVPRAIAILNGLRYKVFVVTNQRGVALGLVTPSELDRMHRFIASEVASAGGDIQQFYVCPHDLGQCGCRKPKPGMLFRAQHEYSIQMSGSWMIGDSASDIAAARRAGCGAVFIGSTDSCDAADLYASSLFDAATIIDGYSLGTTVGRYAK